MEDKKFKLKLRDIAALQREMRQTKNETLKKALASKIQRIDNEIRDTWKSTKSLASSLLSARKKISELSASDFNELIRRLARKSEYSFLKRLSKSEIKDDMERTAKPVGYRFKGEHNYKVPTKQQIRDGKKNGTVYYENRRRRSDVSRVAKLAKGGNASGELYQWTAFDEKEGKRRSISASGTKEYLNTKTFQKMMKGNLEGTGLSDVKLEPMKVDNFEAHMKTSVNAILKKNLSKNSNKFLKSYQLQAAVKIGEGFEVVLSNDHNYDIVTTLVFDQKGKFKDAEITNDIKDWSYNLDEIQKNVGGFENSKTVLTKVAKEIGKALISYKGEIMAKGGLVDGDKVVVHNFGTLNSTKQGVFKRYEGDYDAIVDVNGKEHKIRSHSVVKFDKGGSVKNTSKMLRGTGKSVTELSVREIISLDQIESLIKTGLIERVEKKEDGGSIDVDKNKTTVLNFLNGNK